ncbi:hypothetical protein [Pseudalkalibacillus decolorationis]|uniref:hypothetical protein n=1 Tax=Pseudalkalibacillus decolorationis TaxID=163879 RepID=UPI0021494C69|nr:hypothetical protein [Pseudalkalibacillus decolorationis]
MVTVRDRNIIELCLACKEHCERYLNEGVTMYPKLSTVCTQLLTECSEICSYTANALKRETPFSQEICHLCELICEACGNECSVQIDLTNMSKSADLFYELAENCRYRFV